MQINNKIDGVPKISSSSNGQHNNKNCLFLVFSRSANIAYSCLRIYFYLFALFTIPIAVANLGCLRSKHCCWLIYSVDWRNTNWRSTTWLPHSAPLMEMEIKKDIYNYARMFRRRYNVIGVIDMVCLTSRKAHRWLLGSSAMCAVHNCAVSIDLTESFSSDTEIRAQSGEKREKREQQQILLSVGIFCSHFFSVSSAFCCSVYIIICSTFLKSSHDIKAFQRNCFIHLSLLLTLCAVNTHMRVRVVAERVIGVNENHSIDA